MLTLTWRNKMPATRPGGLDLPSKTQYSPLTSFSVSGGNTAIFTHSLINASPCSAFSKVSVTVRAHYPAMMKGAL